MRFTKWFLPIVHSTSIFYSKTEGLTIIRRKYNGNKIRYSSLSSCKVFKTSACTYYSKLYRENKHQRTISPSERNSSFHYSMPSASKNQQEWSSCHTSSTNHSFRTALSSFHSESNNDDRSNFEFKQWGAGGEGEGRVVARIIPKEFEEYDIKKSTAFRVNPSSFRTILAEFISDDSNCEIYSQHKQKQQKDIRDKKYKLCTIVETENLSPSELNLVLDLDMSYEASEDVSLSSYKNEEVTPKRSTASINVHMNRDGNENVNRTLERLEISTSKKISKLNNKNQNKNIKPKRGKSKVIPSKDKNNDGRNKQQQKQQNNSNNTMFHIYTKSIQSNNGNNTEKCNIEGIDDLNTVELFRKLHHETSSSSVSKQEKQFGISIPSNPNLDLISNPPTIISINSFENFTSKIYTGVPLVIQTKIIHATRAIVSWFIDDKLVLYDCHSFIPQQIHIGKKVGVMIQPILDVDDISFFDDEEVYQFENQVEQLPFMPIVSPLRDEYTKASRTIEEKDNSIRVVTYNILADLYVSREADGGALFPHVKQDHLKKTRRMPMIVAEILAYDADIICLQEVDGSVYEALFEPVMSTMGYDGYYSNKTSCQREGCAMFYSREKFVVDDDEKDEWLESFSIRDLFELKSTNEISDIEKSNDEEQGSKKKLLSHWNSIIGINALLRDHDELRKVIMEKIGQVVQIAKLRLRKPIDSKLDKIVIANSHLFYHPMADHIRAMQAFVVCKKIDEIRKQDAYQYPYPFILCGDLNSDPLSGAAQLLFTGTLLPEHHDCWKNLHEYKWDCGDNEFMVEHGYIGNDVGVTELKYEEEAFDDAQEEEQRRSKPCPPLISLPPSFPKLISGCLEMPEFTNYAIDFIDTLDYVLASEPNAEEIFGFKKKKSAPMPDESEIKRFVAMPNEFMPSDHVSVVCDLEWKVNDKK